MSTENTPETSNPAAAFQSLLQKHQNDANQVALALFGETHKLRSDKRELKKQLEALQAKAPAEGAVVLTGEKAKAWEAYQALGKPEEVKASLEAKATAEADLKKLHREKQIASVATVAKFKPEVLTKLSLMAAEELEFSVEEIESDGEKIQRAMVKQGDALTPLSEFAQAKWPEFMPALQVPSQTPEQPAAQQTQLAHAGTRLPAQTGGGKASNKPGLVNSFLEELNARASKHANPLAPKTTGE